MFKNLPNDVINNIREIYSGRWWKSTLGPHPVSIIIKEYWVEKNRPKYRLNYYHPISEIVWVLENANNLPV